MNKIVDSIKNEISQNNVVLFMKGTPVKPLCGFSGQVCQVLNYYKIDFKHVNVLTSNELRAGIKEYSDWPTIPQLYVKGEFIGGRDIVYEMFQSGELAELFQSKGIEVSNLKSPL